MKKLLIFTLTLIIAFSACLTVFSDGKFETVILKAPKEAVDNYIWETAARYKDTKEPIPLSKFYGESVYVTIPSENKDREIEAYIPDFEAENFTDYNPAEFEFYTMAKLAGLGVILGNEKGEALPGKDVTRAEATAMIMRFTGLKADESYELKFLDVDKEDWFYGVVAAANKYGIVLGDSDEIFAPGRKVTREEITLMTVRAMKLAGLYGYGSYDTNVSDADEISDWAIEAYEYIGGNCASDYENSDPEHPTRVLNPKKAATRYDIAYILNNVIERGQVYPSAAAIRYGFDKEMPVMDGSTSTYPFTQAVYGMLFSNGEAHPDFPAKHSKSHESYEKLINGEVDMLFAATYPASDILELAEQKGVELELIPIAYDAMIFFTNIENPAIGLKKEQISEIYVNNSYESWTELSGNDAKLYPYCRNNDSGSHAMMEKHFLNGNEINEKIQRETTSVSMSNVLTDVMASKTTEPEGYGLGYSIYYYFNNMDMFYNTKSRLKLLAIDGVMPSDETIADGSYPLSGNTYVVLRKDSPEDSPERKMAEFILTEEGQVCVENAGYGKLKK